MENLFTDEELPYVLLMLNEGQAKINDSKAFAGYQNIKIQETIIEKVRSLCWDTYYKNQHKK